MANLYSLTLSVYLVIASPSMAAVPQSDSSKLLVNKSVKGIFVSNWEPDMPSERSKNQETVQYSFKKLLPRQQIQQLQDGELIVFIRGYQFKDSAVTDKPLSIPFYIFMTDEKDLNPLVWNYTTSSNQLVVTLQGPSELDEKLSLVKKKVQFRYFLLDKTFLKRKKLTPKALRNMSYQQLVRLTSSTL